MKDHFQASSCEFTASWICEKSLRWIPCAFSSLNYLISGTSGGLSWKPKLYTRSRTSPFHTLTKGFCRDRFVAHRGELSSVADPFSVHICWITAVCDQMRPRSYSLPWSFLICHNRCCVLRCLRVSWPFSSIPVHHVSFPFPASPLSCASRTGKVKPAVHCLKHVNRLHPVATIYIPVLWVGEKRVKWDYSFCKSSAENKLPVLHWTKSVYPCHYFSLLERTSCMPHFIGQLHNLVKRLDFWSQRNTVNFVLLLNQPSMCFPLHRCSFILQREEAVDKSFLQGGFSSARTNTGSACGQHLNTVSIKDRTAGCIFTHLGKTFSTQGFCSNKGR